jgi:hypothetical protein
MSSSSSSDSFVSLQPYLLNKPRVAVDARPWRQFLDERDNARYLPPGGTLSLTALARAVRHALETSDPHDDDWLMRTLARDERRGLLFTYVPDLTMSIDASPFIPSRLDVNTRARVVALLLRRAYRPRADETVDERWLQLRLDPQSSRWFATLSDVVGDPAHYPERWKARAFQLHRSSYGDRAIEQLQRDWDAIVDGDRDLHEIGVAPRELHLLLYPARLFIVARWLQRLGFAHVMDWEATVPRPDEDRAREIAPERELKIVDATHVLERAPTHAQQLQLSILWLHGIVPDAARDDDEQHWRLRHVSGWSAHELRPRLARARNVQSATPP